LHKCSQDFFNKLNSR